MERNYKKMMNEVTVNGRDWSIEVGYDPATEYGHFEIYDIESGGEDGYAEGGLWFKGKELVDYDGVYALPKMVIDLLTKMGLDASYAL
jgi:hypothetical protein